MSSTYESIKLPNTEMPNTDIPNTDRSSEAGGAERSLLGLITDIQNGLAKRFRERTTHLGISRSQWRVLSALSGRPGATQTELADLVGIGRAPLGKIVDRLEAQGWVERRNDPNDRRVNRIYLTKDVGPIAEPTRIISEEVVNELLQDLPAEERENFRRTVRHLHRKLGFSADASYMHAVSSD